MNQKTIKAVFRMPFQDPSNIFAHIWMLLVASWGATVNYISRIKRGTVTKFSLIEWLGELVIASFSGILTYWVCLYVHLDPLLTAAAVGVSGHAGGRTVYFFETVFNKKLEDIAKRLG